MCYHHPRRAHGRHPPRQLMDSSSPIGFGSHCSCDSSSCGLQSVTQGQWVARTLSQVSLSLSSSSSCREERTLPTARGRAYSHAAAPPCIQAHMQIMPVAETTPPLPPVFKNGFSVNLLFNLSNPFNVQHSDLGGVGFCLQFVFLKTAYLGRNLFFVHYYFLNSCQTQLQDAVKHLAGVARVVQQEEPWGAEAMPSLLLQRREGESCPRSPDGSIKVRNTTSPRAGRLASGLQRRFRETPAFGKKETPTLVLSHGRTGRPGACCRPGRATSPHPAGERWPHK